MINIMMMMMMMMVMMMLIKLNVVNVVDYQSDASTKQFQAECEDISEELYQKHMEWVDIFKRSTTPSHRDQDEQVVKYFYVSCIILIKYSNSLSILLATLPDCQLQFSFISDTVPLTNLYLFV